ncbi:luciferase [Mycolicibacterium wolinskyi]|uniref:Luciferase n=1 Tax=Mycolicibacterium wolinskyi TaxID=59750 RepID=A0A132PKN4_9MYCO|nr:LLM class flavin-dependent oxidoreductase [Mycolicibacterium wolinskyi]KWX22898.1 luciferase [Mycolicibacterium wolinskyi]
MAVSLSVGVEVTGDGLDDPGGDTTTRGIAALARRLESAGVSYWVIGAQRGEAPDAASVSLDPSVIATVAARHSTTLGLVVAAAGHRDHPYNLARRLVSVDHAAQGRVGWLALDFDHTIALNAATDTWTDARLDRHHTADVVSAVRTLWRTWPLDSVVGDRVSGVFTDVTRIRRADVRRGYDIAGPLNVPGSVQGDLPVWRQAHAGEAAEGADLLVVEYGEPIPRDRATVVRLRTGDGIDAALERLARSAVTAGAILRLAPDELPDVLDRVLPDARGRGIVSPAGAGTLRHRLRLPVPVAPDLTGHRTVFATVPNPGGRL